MGRLTGPAERGEPRPGAPVQSSEEDTELTFLSYRG